MGSWDRAKDARETKTSTGPPLIAAVAAKRCTIVSDRSGAAEYSRDAAHSINCMIGGRNCAGVRLFVGVYAIHASQAVRMFAAPAENIP